MTHLRYNFKLRRPLCLKSSSYSQFFRAIEVACVKHLLQYSAIYQSEKAPMTHLLYNFKLRHPIMSPSLKVFAIGSNDLHLVTLLSDQCVAATALHRPNQLL